jgi:hypothetical protein
MNGRRSLVIIGALPLTIKVRISSSWDQVEATQGEKTVPVSNIEHDGNSYALVQAVPDRGQVILQPATR